MKTNKKPSLCLSGTPSSAQRLTKIRPNASTPIRSLQPVLNNEATMNNEDQPLPLPLPPVLHSTSFRDSKEQVFSPALDDAQYCTASEISTDIAPMFVNSITDGMKTRFGSNYKFKSAHSIRNGYQAESIGSCDRRASF